MSIDAFYHRIKDKKGPVIAIKAAARKIAVCYYNVMTKGVEYVEYGIHNYELKIKEQRTKNLKKQALNLGYNLIPQLE